MSKFKELNERVENIEMLIKIDSGDFKPYTNNLKSMLKEAKQNASIGKQRLMEVRDEN